MRTIDFALLVFYAAGTLVFLYNFYQKGKEMNLWG